MDTNTPLLWPIPQEITSRDDALSLSQAVIAVPAGARDADIAPARLLADMLADDFGIVVPVIAGDPPVGRTPIHITIAGRRGAGRTPGRLPHQPEGYLLRVSADGATLVGRDSRGAQHGVATLLQLAQRRGSEVVLRGAEIRDWPHKPVRMVHLYLPGAEHLGYARRYLRDFLVRYKFNGLFVELGGGVRLPNRPEIAQGWRRFVQELRAIGDTGPIYGEHCPLGPGGRFAASVHTHLADGLYLEPDDLTRLSDLARGYQLDFVPEIQSLSHAYYLALAYPEIAELREADFPDTYCPCNPRSYEILFDVMAAYTKLTNCHSVHIGHDEWRAAGLCPQCRQRDTGELFGEDVVKIASWLTERGLGVWMWGDHLVPDHNARARSHKGKVWYDHPDTMRAAQIIARGAPNITILNWSWYLGAEKGDRVFADLGFRQIFGNFDGRRFPEWPARSAPEAVLGAEISSWCAWDDFELGMIHYPEALWSANLLWSSQWPVQEEADRSVARLLPKLRDRMRWNWEKPRLWSEAVLPARKRCISIAPAANAPLKTDGWDLSGLRTGRREYDGIPYEIAEGADSVAVVDRSCLPADRSDSVRQELAPAPPPASNPIPVGGRYASLIFWQVATGKGGHPAHAGDGTNHPREAAELLGYYEIRYADGLLRSAEIRYGENIGAWDSGHELLYYAREVPAGTLPDGRPLLIWGLEWTNPRPAVTIESVVLKGARPLPETRDEGGSSDARPILLGITAIEHPRWEDYRPGKEGKLPGYTV
ncbi:MAG: glycoside hydrolase family 20 zincin-like fold domain-containing protein [Armatimonadota bacterium]